MTREEKIDLALQSVLNAGGLSLKHLPDDNVIKAMRETMSNVMSDSFLDGSNAMYKLLTRKEINLQEKFFGKKSLI